MEYWKDNPREFISGPITFSSGNGGEGNGEGEYPPINLTLTKHQVYLRNSIQNQSVIEIASPATEDKAMTAVGLSRANPTRLLS